MLEGSVYISGMDYWNAPCNRGVRFSDCYFYPSTVLTLYIQLPELDSTAGADPEKKGGGGGG